MTENERKAETTRVGHTRTHTKEFKSRYDSALCPAVPLSISVSFYPFRGVKILHLYSVDEKNEGWGIGVSLRP